VVLLFVGLIIGLFFWGTYNRLVTLDQEVNKKWGDVQTVYQRRADLIPNLVNTVAGAANFEKSTLTEVTMRERASDAFSSIRTRRRPMLRNSSNFSKRRDNWAMHCRAYSS
jgi:hypothetical protein